MFDPLGLMLRQAESSTRLRWGRSIFGVLMPNRICLETKAGKKHSRWFNGRILIPILHCFHMQSEKD
jgi:hypothetical protein